MSKINAINFIKCWKEFDNKESLIKYWDEPKWTERIIGPRKSTRKKSPLGKFLEDYFDKENIVKLKYLTENYKIDLVLSSCGNDNFEINDIEGNKLKIEDFYPRSYSILVEHENDIRTCWEEMAKLTYFKARLKVLITYNDSLKRDEYNERVSKEICENFEKIIMQSNSIYPENDLTEYLLIIGNKTTQNNKDYIKWNCKIYNTNVEEMKL
ncbi:MAG: hypothetical protein K8S16_16045 [Bacteroidales bacterium]|nr:hypothetical protein [Bacteroidales bacterium]